MAVPPEATTNSSAPPSSNAANKLPTSSRKCCQYFNAMFTLLSAYSGYWPSCEPFQASITELEQIAFRPSQHLKRSAIFPTTITHQAMHTQISLCSTMPLEVALSAVR
jgi:hypothetical protein